MMVITPSHRHRISMREHNRTSVLTTGSNGVHEELDFVVEDAPSR